MSASVWRRLPSDFRCFPIALSPSRTDSYPNKHGVTLVARASSPLPRVLCRGFRKNSLASPPDTRLVNRAIVDHSLGETSSLLCCSLLRPKATSTSTSLARSDISQDIHAFRRVPAFSSRCSGSTVIPCCLALWINGTLFNSLDERLAPNSAAGADR